MQETWVWSLGWRDPLEEGMVIHSSILAWRIPRTEETGGLYSMGSQRVRHNWSDEAAAATVNSTCMCIDYMYMLFLNLGTSKVLKIHYQTDDKVVLRRHPRTGSGMFYCMLILPFPHSSSPHIQFWELLTAFSNGYNKITFSQTFYDWSIILKFSIPPSSSRTEQRIWNEEGKQGIKNRPVDVIHHCLSPWDQSETCSYNSLSVAPNPKSSEKPKYFHGWYGSNTWPNSCGHKTWPQLTEVYL